MALPVRRHSIKEQPMIILIITTWMAGVLFAASMGYAAKRGDRRRRAALRRLYNLQRRCRPLVMQHLDA